MSNRSQPVYSHKATDAQTRIRLGVGVFVRDSRGRILLEKRSDDGTWALPGGGIDPGESIRAAALREVREETGLTVNVTRLLGVYSEPADRIVTFGAGDVVHKIDVIVEAEIVSGELKRSHESEALEFFDPGHWPVDLCPPAQAPVADYLSGLSGAIR